MATTSRVFVPDRALQPSLMFASKSLTYPSEAPLRCSKQGWAPSRTKNIRLG